MSHFVYEDIDYGEDEGECKLELINGEISGKPKYEIIGGIKFIMSPAPNIAHATIVSRIITSFTNYILDNNVRGAVFGDNTDVYFTEDEHYMPDISVVCNPEILKNGKKILGAPDLVAEVLSLSTMKNDLGKKKNIYEKYGVKEYWIVDQWAKRIEVYHLVKDKFELDDVYMVIDEAGAKTDIKVSIFEDLTIDIRKIFKSWFS